jgi:hypothetical protein
MRAGKIVRSVVLIAAGLVTTLSATSSFANAESAHQPVIAVADAAPLNHFGSTAVPQSLRSPNFNSHLEFSPQVELTHTGPVKANGPAYREGRRMPVQQTSVSQRSLADSLLLALLGVTLIAYQLFRKHRLLRPHPFSL